MTPERVAESLEGYWEKAYWTVVPKLAALLGEAAPDPELDAAMRDAMLRRTPPAPDPKEPGPA